MSRDRATGFIKKMLRVLLDDFGETYIGEMSSRLERIANLRDRIAGVYDSVLSGQGLPEGMTPTTLAGLFARLDSEMSGLQSPTAFAKQDRIIRDDLASASLTTLTGDLAGRAAEPQVVGGLSFDDAIAGQRQAFGDLATDQKAAVAKAADVVPDVVRRVLDSEDQSSLHTSIDQLRDELRRHGLDAAAVDAAAKGVNALNFAHNKEKRRVRTGDRGPYDPATPQGRQRIEAIDRFYQNLDDPAFVKTLPDALRTVLDDPIQTKIFHDRDLRNALETNSGVSRLAHESPTMLMEMWLGYSKGGKKGSFGMYVFDKRTRSHLIGLAGEFHAAFQLGDSHVLLKGPDYDVTIPGTDLVAVAHSDGTIWLIDNKAFQEATVGKVNALVDNILPSMERDVRDFAASGTAQQPAVGPQVRGAVSGQTVRSAVDRISQATKEIQQYLATVPGSKIDTPKVQKQITRILDQHGIKRVVTNAGGIVTGLNDALTKIGIELADLNK